MTDREKLEAELQEIRRACTPERIEFFQAQLEVARLLASLGPELEADTPVFVPREIGEST